jgi:hypothetical protein
MSLKEQSSGRQAIAMIAIVGLIFQAMMAAVMLLRPLAVLSEVSPSDRGAIVVCTGAGFKLITRDENGNPVEKTLPGGECPVCDALAAVTFAPYVEQPSIVAFTATSNPDVLLPTNEHIPTNIAFLTHNNRGPPNQV